MTIHLTESVDEIAAQVRAEIARYAPKKRRTELAADLKISPTALDDRMSGEVEWRITELTRLANLLGVAVADFVPAADLDRLGAQ